jgi:hypothetical protein
MKTNDLTYNVIFALSFDILNKRSYSNFFWNSA